MREPSPTMMEWDKITKKAEQIKKRSDAESTACPACSRTLDFWNCKTVCHYCGLRFTCDE